jgi:hypothetical protein
MIPNSAGPLPAIIMRNHKLTLTLSQVFRNAADSCTGLAAIKYEMTRESVCGAASFLCESGA